MDKTGDFFDSSLSDLKVTDVADILGSNLGVQPLDVTHSGSQSRMFKKAQANVLIAVESLGEETVKRMDLPNFNSPSTSAWSGSSVLKRDLSFPVYPSNSLSVAASLVSGQLPSSHGIVGRQWRSKSTGGSVSAFNEANEYGQVANLADIISQSFHGQSVVVSFSSDWQQAKLHSVNPNSKQTSIALAINRESGDIENLHDSPITHPLTHTREQMLESLRGSGSLFSSLPVSVSIRQDQVTVAFPSTWGTGNDETSFDLQAKADYAFFAELQYMYELPGLLSSNGLQSDNSPDLISLTAASLTGLIEKYGRESQEVRAAMHILNAALPKILNKYYTLYDDGVIGEVVLLGSHAASFQTSDTRELLQALSSIMPKQDGIKDYFPSLYLDDTTATRLCSSEHEVLPLTVQPYGYSVYCPWLSLATRKTSFAIHPYVLMASSGAARNSTNSTVTDSDIQIFQVVLWISIIMAYALYWAIYTIGFMSFKKDTLLYSTFNPGWEDRKRR